MYFDDNEFDLATRRYAIAEQTLATTVPAWQAFGAASEEDFENWLKEGRQHETA